MRATRDCNIEIDVTIIVTGYTKGYPETREDPGCGDEVEFDCYIKNEKGELIMLQDEIVNRYADELYELALDIVNDEKEAQRVERAEMKYQDENIRRFQL